MSEAVMTIQGVECYELDGTAYLKLETVARGLGFTRIAASGNEVIRWETVRKYLIELGACQQAGTDDSQQVGKDGLPEFIPENIFYRLAMKAKNETAEKFQALIADEIIPSIRKTGGYLAPELAEQLTSALQAQTELAVTVQSLAERVEALENVVTAPAPADPFAHVVDPFAEDPFAPAAPLEAAPEEEPPPPPPGKAYRKRWFRTLSEKLDLLSARFSMPNNKVLHQIYQWVERDFDVALDEERMRTMEEYELDDCSTLTAIFYDPDFRDYFERFVDHNLAPENRGW